MRKIITLLLLGCFYNIISAQDTNFDYYDASSREYEARMLPSNPDVGSLGTYGFKPINKYTGTANVSVPIHNITLGKISLPISLTYNTGGIKVAQEATWVGLGWNLSAGAVITREINGFDDTKNTQNSQPKGYVFTKQFLERKVPEYTLYMPQSSVNDLVFGNQQGVNLDTEPDIFSVNLFGNSIRFALEKLDAGETIVNGIALNDTFAQIEFDTETRFFTIRDGQGFTYHFDTLEYSTTSMKSQHGSYSSTYGEEELIRDINTDAIPSSIHDIEQDVTSWRLNKIIDPNGREIHLEYERAIHMSLPYTTEKVAIHCNKLFSDKGDPNPYVLEVGGGINPGVYTYTARIHSFENTYLKRIYGDFGSVDFELSEDRSDLFSIEGYNTIRVASQPYSYPFIPFSTNKAKKLVGITVKNQDNDPIKSVSFNYTYFNQNKLDNSNLSDYEKKKYVRLKLDDVTVNDKTYSFEYISPNALPKKTSKKTDFWGFYNEITNNRHIPRLGRFHASMATASTFGFEMFFDYQGGSRRSDFNFGKIGLLESITHPTKGKTVYQYEGNRATVEKPERYTPTYSTKGSFRSSRVSSSSKYKFNYQYLKKAVDPNYSFASYSNVCNTSSSLIQNNGTFQITSTDICGADYNFIAKATISCATGCNQGINPSGVATKLTNITTGKVYNLFYFEQVNSNGNNLEIKKNLPIGTYKFEFTPAWAINRPATVVVTNSSYATVIRKVEQDTSSDTDYEEFEVGGARITSVIEKDHDDATIQVRQFNYNFTNPEGNISSSGKLMDQLIFHSKNNGFFEYTPEHYYENTFNMHSESAIRLNNSASGSHIGYSQVSESVVDRNGVTNGETIHKYMNFSNSYVTRNIGSVKAWTVNNPPPPTVSYGEVYLLNMMPKTASHKNGLVLEELVKDNTGKTIQETITSYDEFRGTNFYFQDEAYPHISHQLFQISSPCPVAVCGFFPEITYYKLVRLLDITAHKLTRTKESITTYKDGEELTNTINYFYQSREHFEPTEIVSSSSIGEVSQKLFYPEDILTKTHPLRVDNRLATPIQFETYTDSKKTGARFVKFEKDSDTTNKTQATAVQLAKEDDDFEDRVLFERYDDVGTLLQMKEVNGVTTSYVWS